MHFAYTVLDTETNYIEKLLLLDFLPIILYNADKTEFSFYQFNSIPVGVRDNNDFLKELKKETFLDWIIMIFLLLLIIILINYIIIVMTNLKIYKITENY